MRIAGPSWQGAYAGLNQQENAATQDLNAGMGLKYALWEDQQRRRDSINALLRRQADIRARENAAKSNQGWLGVGGAAAGAGVGALLAAPTGGMSMLAGAGLGSSIGATGGGALDMAMGNDGRGGMQLGSTLMDFSTEFLPTTPNPYYQAAQAVGGSSPGSELMFDSYGAPGMAMSPNRREY